MDNKRVSYKFDINQGYHHINTDDNYQKYLGFFWKIDGKIIYFTLIILPFSFRSALFILTKVMPCLVKILEKVRDKKFAYLLMMVLDSPPPPPPPPPSSVPFPLIRLNT